MPNGLHNSGGQGSKTPSSFSSTNKGGISAVGYPIFNETTALVRLIDVHELSTLTYLSLISMQPKLDCRSSPGENSILPKLFETLFPLKAGLSAQPDLLDIKNAPSTLGLTEKHS